MIRTLLTALAACVLFLNPSGSFAQKKFSAKEENSLLWRISGKGLQKPSFLFGTIHIICPDAYLWTPVMQQSFQQSDKVCMEMDMDDPGLMVQMAAGMMDLSGKKLKDYFKPDEYARFERYVKDSMDTPVPLEAIQMMKPMALLAVIIKKRMPCDSTLSYETNFVTMAQEQKKEVIGLESVSEQLDIMNMLPVDSIITHVMATVDGKPETEDDHLTEMMAAYKTQNLAELAKIMQSSDDMAHLQKELLDNRNQRWIGRIEEKTKDQSVFFAVGAGHLSGPQGVISLLRKAGYTVTAVK